MRIHVKYCGGCNPTYDRVKLAGDAAASANAQLVHNGAEAHDVCLLVSGCERGCAAREQGTGCTHVWQWTDPAQLGAALCGRAPAKKRGKKTEKR